MICIFFAGDDDGDSFLAESVGEGEDANEDDWSLAASALGSRTGARGGGCAREARRRVNDLIRRLKVREE